MLPPTRDFWPLHRHVWWLPAVVHATGSQSLCPAFFFWPPNVAKHSTKRKTGFFGHMHEFISPETLISRQVLYNRKPRNHEKHCPQKPDHP
jgi:hypothetical protein